MTDPRSTAAPSPDDAVGPAGSPPSTDAAAVLRGEVAAVVYADPATGFGVVEVAPDEPVVEAADDELPRAAGPLAGLVAGQPVRLIGAWTTHPRHGRTFAATYFEVEAPRTLDGLAAFLESDRFPGVGKVLAQRITEAFGLELPRVLADDPEELARLPGVSRDLARRIGAAWAAAGALAALVQRLGEAGAPPGVARNAHRALGDDAIEVLDRDPYELVAVPGARWEHAEALAAAAGLGHDDPRRQRAAAAAAHARLRERGGHVAVPTAMLAGEAARLLGGEPGEVADALDHAARDGRLGVEEAPELVGDGDASDSGMPVGGADPRRWYLPAALRDERRLAADLRRLATAPSRVAAAVGADARVGGRDLADEQAAAVRAALTSPVTVLTGGPGTGKTRAVVEVAAACEAAELNIALCAPTGRAAKRLEEVTGRPASTVHRLLEAQPAGGGAFRFGYGAQRRLPHDLVVADEVSMADLGLCAALAAAIDSGAHLLLVGDADQLPPVGPGAVLRDALAVARDAGAVGGDGDAGAVGGDGDAGAVGGDGESAAAAPVVAARLRTVHRQAAASRIVTLAHEVNRGVAPVPRGRDGDVFAVPEQRDAIGDRVAAIVAERAPAFFDCTSADVQVLAPMYRGPAGVDALNAALRDRLNPAAGRPAVAGIREGDRVVQTRNDPELGVANGDVGEVAALDAREAVLEVAFPHGVVRYGADAAEDLRPAWCLTVHKAQGGEWPVVVLVLDRGHRMMLARELVYTAITRAREGLLLVGDPALLARAAQRRGAGLADRATLLAERLRAGG